MMESVIPVMLHKYFIPSKTIKASISVCINVWNLSKSFFSNFYNESYLF